MKRVWVLMLLLALGLALVAAARATGIFFYDDFEDGNDNGWVQVDRYWHVRGGRYHLDGGYMPGADSRDGFSFTHVGDPAWTDYVFEFTFDTTNAPSEYNPDWENTMHVHQTFAAFRVIEAKHTEYRLSMWVPGDPGSNTCVEKYFYTNRPVWTVCTEPSAVLGTNIGKVIVEGGHIQVYINGKLAIDYTDPDSEPIPYGGVGLGALWEVNAWFDNVRVTPILSAMVNLDPAVLNLQSKGQWVTTYIELPDGYNVADIDVSTVMLEGTISAEDHPTALGDYDGDGIADLMVKFNCQALIERLVGTTGEVTLTVSGELNDGPAFAGSDTILVIYHKK